MSVNLLHVQLSRSCLHDQTFCNTTSIPALRALSQWCTPEWTGLITDPPPRSPQHNCPPSTRMTPHCSTGPLRKWRGRDGIERHGSLHCGRKLHFSLALTGKGAGLNYHRCTSSTSSSLSTTDNVVHSSGSEQPASITKLLSWDYQKEWMSSNKERLKQRRKQQQVHTPTHIIGIRTGRGWGTGSMCPQHWMCHTH